jgi:hypothetical protein
LTLASALPTGALIIADTVAVCIRMAAPHTALSVSLAARPGTLIVADTIAVCIRVSAPAPLPFTAGRTIVANAVVVGIRVVGTPRRIRCGILLRCDV